MGRKSSLWNTCWGEVSFSAEPMVGRVGMFCAQNYDSGFRSPRERRGSEEEDSTQAIWVRRPVYKSRQRESRWRGGGLERGPEWVHQGRRGRGGGGREEGQRRRQARRGAGGWRGRCACQVGCPRGGAWVPALSARGSRDWLSLCKGVTLTPLAGPGSVGLPAGRSSRYAVLTSPRPPTTRTEISGCPGAPHPSRWSLGSGLPASGVPRQPLTHPRAGRPPRGRCRWPRRWAARPSRCR